MPFPLFSASTILAPINNRNVLHYHWAFPYITYRTNL